MADGGHTLDLACAYYEDDPNTIRYSDSSNPPKVKAQFFYVSSLPIDDPLSPLPPIQADKTTNAPPKPFSVRDNGALEEAWQEFQKDNENPAESFRPSSRGLNRMFSFPKFERGMRSPPDVGSPTVEASSFRVSTGFNESRLSTASYGGQGSSISFQPGDSPSAAHTKRSRKTSVRSDRSRKISQGQSESQVLLSQEVDQKNGNKPVDTRELQSTSTDQNSTRRRRLSPPHERFRLESNSPAVTPISESDLPQASATILGTGQPSSFTENDISGRPFARAPSSSRIRTSTQIEDFAETESLLDDKTMNNMMRSQETVPTEFDTENDEAVFVPVGASRLHLVQFPDLQMKPIYWSPINDNSSVIRATWFYKDTMLPVPVDVANRLEIGYEGMKPWTEAYQDEINACIEHGALAELKVVHRLWPEEKASSRPGTSTGDKYNDEEIDDDAASNYGLPVALENAAADRRKANKRKHFGNHSVVYTNSRDAQILRPSAIPSVSRNRRPLNSIRKGRQIGIAVVRGFERKAWNKLHPNPRTDIKVAKSKAEASVPQSGDAAVRSRRASCPKCEVEEKPPQVSDLILVIHGIGQKLSERVDSFHFTHAINGLRREFNVELAADAVRGLPRESTGMMVLPVNWRLTVNFDDEATKSTEDLAENKYELKDITPETLPAVRSLISDVMLDIPYYMSHHKSKMTSAVVREANRVYRLWCRNNPGFHEYGRVHLVAHSLGSVMAMEILSNQPTYVPKNSFSPQSKPSEKMFEFNTSNLFCCGSPSGFFLLLNGASLVPRKGRQKAGMEGEDHGRGIAGDGNRYGCLAVDNLYNICHKNDPIAYQLNACVDSNYAASLQQITIPSASQSFFGRIGNSLRWASSSAYDAYGFVTPVGRPTVQHMPSTVELETHNFTREEIAEKRMFLLNDNGQVDFFLSSGGGPLEIQYLNMLSAHSSYWILPDFVRFLVVEIGRKPGKNNTLPVLRAVKKREYKRGNIG